MSDRGSRRPRPTPRRPAGSRPSPSIPSLVSGRLSVAALVSLVGLLVIAVATWGLGSGNLPFVPGAAAAPGASDQPDVERTPTPPDVVEVPTPSPGFVLPGTLVYAKDGSIWIQDANGPTKLVSGNNKYSYSMPTFSPDGSTVYFVRTRRITSKWIFGGVLKHYRLDVPTLMSIPTSGGSPQPLLDGIVKRSGGYRWSGFIREPAVSPDGRYIAIATDLPDPTVSDVVIKLYDLKTGKIKDLGLSQVPPLGHQDPAWKPDGSRLLYVRNDRDGAKGASVLYQYNPANDRTKAVTKPGYLYPSWSPDGHYIVATETSAYGTDVVILNASNGAEVLRLTSDGNSWAPTWSPRGDQIAYLHVSGQVIDLRLIQLEGSAPDWTAKPSIDLTTSAGLDGVSRPGWFIPADQLPTPTPAPSSAASPVVSPAGS